VLTFVLVFFSTAFSVCVAGLLRLQIAYASAYTDINVETAYNMITNGSYSDLVVLDVRTKTEYDGGHIYGAVWIPHTELESRINDLAGHENHEIIVYCLSGDRSVTASSILDSYNFTKVYNMLEGITAWQSFEYPLHVPTVHNINTTLNYDAIQAAINAPQTLDGHTFFVEEGTYCENVVVHKSLSIVGDNRSTTIIDGNFTGIVINITASNVNITGFTIRKSGTGCPNSGIYIGKTSTNNNLSNNIITENYVGIGIWYSSNNTVLGNNIKNNKIAIRLYESTNNNVVWNNIKNNSHCITLDFSNNNSISGNNMTANNYSGILASYSSNNTISGNSIINNAYGFYIYSSPHNIIYHNDFVDNTEQVFSTGSTNFWDDDAGKGNYWSDYKEKYPNATEIDNSGIWDTPYVIDENNQDNYPIVPEFPTWTSMLPLLIVLTVATAICKRRPLKTPIR
jgi:parallel beta-helix repeat protein